MNARAKKRSQPVQGDAAIRALSALLAREVSKATGFDFKPGSSEIDAIALEVLEWTKLHSPEITDVEKARAARFIRELDLALREAKEKVDRAREFLGQRVLRVS